MQKIEPAQTITIDGVEHQVADFSDTVKRLVAIYSEWQNEAVAERLALAKTEAAIRGLDAELVQTIKSELTAKAAEASAAKAANDEASSPAAE